MNIYIYIHIYIYIYIYIYVCVIPLHIQTHTQKYDLHNYSNIFLIYFFSNIGNAENLNENMTKINVILCKLLYNIYIYIG